jgi:hypothetical protein
MKICTAMVLLGLTTTAALGQEPQAPSGHAHVPGMMHGGAAAQTESPAYGPVQAGQSAFAAIQEIVEILEADPGTDWSKVDIEGLRRHLVDMNNVTLASTVEAAAVDGGARFTVTGAGEVAGSIRRMVIAHADTMDGVDGWRFVAAERPDGATLTVTAPDAAAVPKIRALGFAGVMTRGMHHQEHHLMIASGAGPHH